MSLSFYVHYQNKYPGGRVFMKDNDIDVYCRDGQHRVAIRNGRCVSEMLGCVDRHDLSPIPKDARVRKLSVTGKVVNDEEAAIRRTVQAELAEHPCGGPGKVPSIQELHSWLNPEHVEMSGGKLLTGGFSHTDRWQDMKKYDSREAQLKRLAETRTVSVSS